MHWQWQCDRAVCSFKHGGGRLSECAQQETRQRTEGVLRALAWRRSTARANETKELTARGVTGLCEWLGALLEAATAISPHTADLKHSGTRLLLCPRPLMSPQSIKYMDCEPNSLRLPQTWHHEDGIIYTSSFGTKSRFGRCYRPAQVREFDPWNDLRH